MARKEVRREGSGEEAGGQGRWAPASLGEGGPREAGRAGLTGAWSPCPCACGRCGSGVSPGSGGRWGHGGVRPLAEAHLPMAFLEPGKSSRDRGEPELSLPRVLGILEPQWPAPPPPPAPPTPHPRSTDPPAAGEGQWERAGRRGLRASQRWPVRGRLEPAVRQKAAEGRSWVRVALGPRPGLAGPQLSKHGLRGRLRTFSKPTGCPSEPRSAFWEWSGYRPSVIDLPWDEWVLRECGDMCPWTG